MPHYHRNTDNSLQIHTAAEWLPERFFSRADANEKAFSRGLAPAAMQMWCLMTREASPHQYIVQCSQTLQCLFTSCSMVKNWGTKA